MLCVLERAHIANKVFHLISQSIHRAVSLISQPPRGDSRGAKSTGTHIHTDNAKRGHKIPIGTCFFSPCSLVVKVHPPGKEVEGGGEAREGDLDPSAEG